MAEKTSGVAAQFKKLSTKMLYKHCHGYALNLSVKDACIFFLSMLNINTFTMDVILKIK